MERRDLIKKVHCNLEQPAKSSPHWLHDCSSFSMQHNQSCDTWAQQYWRQAVISQKSLTSLLCLRENIQPREFEIPYLKDKKSRKGKKKIIPQHFLERFCKVKMEDQRKPVKWFGSAFSWVTVLASSSQDSKQFTDTKCHYGNLNAYSLA